MSVKDRLKEFIRFNSISQRQFEGRVGLSNGYINNIVSSISPKVQEKIRFEFPELNMGWVLTGEGYMLKRSGRSAELLFSDIPDAVIVPFISKYDYQKYANYISAHIDREIHLDLMGKPFIIPNYKYHDAQFIAIEVIDNYLDDGSSKSILKDDIALCKSIVLDLIYSIDFSSASAPSVIIHKGQISMGIIEKHDLENKFIRLVSPNKKFPAKDIPFDDIDGLYDITQLVRHI